MINTQQEQVRDHLGGFAHTIRMMKFRQSFTIGDLWYASKRLYIKIKYGHMSANITNSLSGYRASGRGIGAYNTPNV